jgi:hypothetical protein
VTKAIENLRLEAAPPASKKASSNIDSEEKLRKSSKPRATTDDSRKSPAIRRRGMAPLAALSGRQ